MTGRAARSERERERERKRASERASLAVLLGQASGLRGEKERMRVGCERARCCAELREKRRSDPNYRFCFSFSKM
jgi:hypothetical protein